MFSYRDSSFAGHPYSSEDLVLFYNAVEPVDKFVPFFDNIIVGLGGGVCVSIVIEDGLYIRSQTGGAI